MKKFFTLLTIAVALTAHSIQLLPLLYLNTGTNVGDPNAERMDYYAWVKLNASIRAAETNFVNLNAAITNPVPAGIVKTSTTIYELSTNFTFTAGSNYLGAFTNIYSFYAVAAIGVTNQPLTNNMSLDGGVTWQPFYVTNPFTSTLITNIVTNNYPSSYLVSTNLGTNTILISIVVTNNFTLTNYGTNFIPTPIKISTLCANTCTGIVQIATLNDFSAKGRANTFVGQTVDFTGANVLGLPSSAGITNISATATNVPSGGAATAVIAGVTNGIAYAIFGIPTGAANTNTVTVQNFSNQVLSSSAYISYATNYARWRVGSNYLGRVPNISHIFATAGDDGANPPNSYGFWFTGSYTGTNGFFYFTNQYGSLFTTTNAISLWLNATSVPVGNPGSVSIQSVDHPELSGRTNRFFGQFTECDIPNAANQVANKQYVDQVFANAFNNNFSSYSDTNGVSHYVWQFQNQNVSDYAGVLTMAPISFLGLDGTGTNLQFQAALTNVAAGVQIQSSTNLAIVTGFLAWTNYTSVTNTGMVTYTIPINPLWPMQFFRAVTVSSVQASFFVPLNLANGNAYPSNGWNLNYITNALAALGAGKHYWTGNSNGQSLVTLSYSNGTVRFVSSQP